MDAALLLLVLIWVAKGGAGEIDGYAGKDFGVCWPLCCCSDRQIQTETVRMGIKLWGTIRHRILRYLFEVQKKSHLPTVCLDCLEYFFCADGET